MRSFLLYLLGAGGLLASCGRPLGEDFTSPLQEFFLKEEAELHPLQHESSAASGVDEYVLAAVYRVGYESSSPVLFRHMLAPEKLEQRLRRRRLAAGTAVAVSSGSERDRVRTLANMNRVIYPPTNFTKYMDKLGEVYEAGVNIGGGVGENALERAQSETAANQVFLGSR